MADLAIKSSRVVTSQGVKPAVIIIKRGLITDVIKEFPGDENCKNVDMHNRVVMPGVIDPHVHINEPGRTEWEGFDTATKAALSGGLTTLVDMPLNSSPVTTTEKAFEEKLIATKNKLHTNVGFWGGVIPGNENELKPLIQKGVLGFKAFLTHSGIDEFPNVTEDDLRKAMPIISKGNLPLLVHCELQPPLSKGEKMGMRHYQDYLKSRPRSWEDDAIALMIRLCEEFDCRTHIVHLSSSNSIEQIAKAKQKGLPLTVETAPHYLYFNSEEIQDGQTQFKCAPPIRERENNDKLWQALKDGSIDFVATDHSPAPPHLKELNCGDFTKAWGGIASLQFALPALWTAAKKRNCTLNNIVKWLCENPAKLIGKQNMKGKIEKGFDADIIIWRDDKKFTVTENIIQHKHKITPYMNEELFGVVEQSYLAGEKVFDNGVMNLNKGKILFHEL